jgi:hypothetical protein
MDFTVNQKNCNNEKNGIATGPQIFGVMVLYMMLQLTFNAGFDVHHYPYFIQHCTNKFHSCKIFSEL